MYDIWCIIVRIIYHNKDNGDRYIYLYVGALRVFDRGHKGSHLALMVELLAGALPGAAMTDKNNANNWGSLIIAIDPSILGPIEGFQERAAEMCNRVKNAKKLPGQEDHEMYLPGERGDLLEAENLSNGYIIMSKKLYSELIKLSSKNWNLGDLMQSYTYGYNLNLYINCCKFVLFVYTITCIK